MQSPHESPAWLAAVVESSPDAIVASTLDGVILSWNSGAQRILGYTAEEMIGQNAELLRPQEVDGEIARMTARVARGDGFEHRVVRRRKDGQLVTLAAVLTPILDISGAVVGTATVARDLAGQERADAVFRNLVEAAPDAMVCVDEHGVITLANQQAERLFGYPRDELLGQPVEMLMPEQHWTRHVAHRRRYLAAPTARTMGGRLDLQARHSDGRLLPVEISLSAIHTEDGVLIATAIRDVTERREAAIVASSPDAIVARALDGTVLAWNSGAERLYGYAASQMIGTVPPPMLLPDGPDVIAVGLDRGRAATAVTDVRTRVIRSDGTTVEVSATFSPIRDETGAVTGTASIAREITEAKRAEDAVRASDARKTAMLEAALDCIITIDHEGRVVEFNPTAERTFGYAREQVLGQPLDKLIIPAELRARHRSGLAHYLATGEGPALGTRLEMPAVRADGSQILVELAITRVDMPGPPLFTAFLRDLTEKKRAEADHAALTARLQRSERLESLGRLAGGVAHDFNNLLNIVQFYSEFAERDIDNPDEVLASIAHIRGAAEQAARLTRQLLIVGHREAQRPESIQLNDVIGETCDVLSASLGQTIEIETRYDPLLPDVLADRSRMEQVLLNLAVNARDAMPSGGLLTITTRAAAVDTEFARIHPGIEPGSYAELRVTDTGTGMSPEVREHLFDAFFTTKPEGQGTGLGLATVHSIIDEAGGAIEVSSDIGAGTTFRILLPSVDRASRP